MNDDRLDKRRGDDGAEKGGGEEGGGDDKIVEGVGAGGVSVVR